MLADCATPHGGSETQILYYDSRNLVLHASPTNHNFTMLQFQLSIIFYSWSTADPELGTFHIIITPAQ